MPDDNKSFLNRFSIKNPLARIVYSSAPIISAALIEIGKLSADPNAQQALISTLATAGIIVAPIAGVAGNVLAEAISQKFFNRFSRKDILENGDLQKAVGDAICATVLTIYDENKSIFKHQEKSLFVKVKHIFLEQIVVENKGVKLNQEVLEKLSNVPTAAWQMLIAELEKDKDDELNLTTEEVEALYPKNLPDIFAIPAAEFNKITVLSKNTWEKVLRKLCRLQAIVTSNDKYPHFTDTISHIAEVLTKNFPELLKHTLVTNIARDGKAYANLQLKIMGEILFYVRENNEKLGAANTKLEEIGIKINLLRNSLDNELQANSAEFDAKFQSIKDSILESRQIIIEAIENLQIDVKEIKDFLIPKVDYSSAALKQAVLSYLMKVADKATELNKIYPEEFKNKEKKSIFFNKISQRVQVVKKKQFDVFKAKIDEKARLDGTFKDELDKKVYDQRGFEAEMSQRETQEYIEIFEWTNKTRQTFKRNVIFGDPGLGKSWLLNFEANKIATEAIQILQNAPDTTEETAKSLKRIKIPIHLRIADIASEAKKDKELALTIVELASFDEKVNDERKTLELYLKETICQRNEAVLLFDALDEVPDDPGKGLTRKEIAGRISNFAQKYQENSFLLTSRKVNYEQVNLRNAHQSAGSDDNLEILAFDEKQIKNYIAGWFDKDSQTADFFFDLLENQTQTAGLSQNPLMLSLMCRLFYENRGEEPIEEAEKQFPTSRCQIYEECLQGLLKDWKDEKSTKTINDAELRSEIRKLERTAFNLFIKDYEQFSENDFQTAFCQIDDIYKITDEQDEASRKFLDECKADGIITETTVGKYSQYRFIHLTFQEYLVASYLARTSDWKDFVFRNKILFNSDWQHSLQLLGGKFSAAEAQDYIAELLNKNGANGEKDILFRPFLLAMYAAKEASNSLSEDYKIELMDMVIRQYYPPYQFRSNDKFLPALQNWGSELVNYLLPILDQTTTETFEKEWQNEMVVYILSNLNTNKKKIIEKIFQQIMAKRNDPTINHSLTWIINNIQDIPVEFAERILQRFIGTNDRWFLQYTYFELKENTDTPTISAEKIFPQFMAESDNQYVREYLSLELSKIKDIPAEFAEKILQQIIAEKNNQDIRRYLAWSLRNIKDIPTDVFGKILQQIDAERNNQGVLSYLAEAIKINIKNRVKDELPFSILKQTLIVFRDVVLNVRFEENWHKAPFLETISMLAARYMIAVPAEGEIIFAED